MNKEGKPTKDEKRVTITNNGWNIFKVINTKQITQLDIYPQQYSHP